jgi:hypothetical protein
MLSIRTSMYRGRRGFLVCGMHNGYRYSIFFDHQHQARGFVRRLKDGEDGQEILRDIWGIAS